MKSETILVEGMTCGHCTMTVEGALRLVGAVGKADLNTGSVQVEYDEAKINLQAIKEAVSATGYIVQ